MVYLGELAVSQWSRRSLYRCARVAGDGEIKDMSRERFRGANGSDQKGGLERRSGCEELYWEGLVCLQ